MKTLTQQEANERHIKRSDYVSCTVAFIDCKKPGSHLKENYSIIGPGVTTSTDQVINLPEPHGFNIGAAAMPNGITNNLHIHFTAEVFIVQKGEWTFRWGSDGEHTMVGRSGDVLSVPTWVFRGFTNNGADDGWLFTILGGDDTGGVIFHPDIITEAADYGLYISRENTLIDTAKGDQVPDASETIPPMPIEHVAQLQQISPSAMSDRLVSKSDRNFRPAFIDGKGAELAPVIGYGITQNREHTPTITNPHTFSVEWLRLEPSHSVSRFVLDEKMVLIMRQGAMRLYLNEHDTVAIDLSAWDTYSVPAGAVRSIEPLGNKTAEALLIVSGDHRKWPRFDPLTLAHASANGRALDAGGYIAEASLLPSYHRTKY